MPNHVRNVLKIRGNADELISKFAVPKDDFEKLITSPSDMIFDFNTVIPEPETKDTCPKEDLRTENSHVQPLPGKEWLDWYSWRTKNWGTKWNAYNGYCEKHKGYALFVFCTAWATPMWVFDKLASLGYDIEVRYADEDLR